MSLKKKKSFDRFCFITHTYEEDDISDEELEFRLFLPTQLEQVDSPLPICVQAHQGSFSFILITNRICMHRYRN